MNDIIKPTAHKIILEQRERMEISGVEDVISFDECGIVLKTVMGILSVDGAELRIINLNVDAREIEISGKVSGVIYQGSQAPKGSFFKKK